ncbi:hypothetical protein WJX81_005578 [Elliptochloris bilobata]|uniref:Uncharacterized protein n=1 Tax=Elliptochloris bilobata TaxID=381761 RepID=A0AAW1RYU9_9CHLO
MSVAKDARRVWTRAIADNDKDTVTGVQTLRNSIMSVSLFTVACGYIGARALPEILLDRAWTERLNNIQGLDPILAASGGVALLQPTVKLAIALVMLLCCFLCFVQSARLFSHVGFLLKAVSSNKSDGRSFERETIAITDCAGTLFSVGIRLFIAFSIAAIWILGPVALMVSTAVFLGGLFFVDFLPL